MSLAKTFAACVASAVLLLQLYVILPLGARGTWYWPFVNYWMYSASWQPGDAVEVFEFRVQPCDRALEAELLESQKLGITHLRFHGTLLIAKQDHDEKRDPKPWKEPTRDEARAMVTRLIAERFPGRYCEAQIWERSYTVGVDNPLAPNLDWNLAQTWPLETVSESR